MKCSVFHLVNQMLSRPQDGGSYIFWVECAGQARQSCCSEEDGTDTEPTEVDQCGEGDDQAKWV